MFKRRIRLFITILLLLDVSLTIFAQNTEEFFPAGMAWKEVIAEPEYLPLDTTYSSFYEIGSDTIINNQTYKQVSKDGEWMSLWIREDTGRVWLLSNEYAREILLYDFRWIPNTTLYTEYIREMDIGAELCKVDFSVNDYKTTKTETQTFQYLWDWEGCTIRGIGRVADLNRNCCMLGFHIPKDILPGAIYSKVLWIRRNNVEIFRSEIAEEWTTTILGTNTNLNSLNNSHYFDETYDLQGRQLLAPQNGVFIQNGKKVAVK